MKEWSVFTCYENRDVRYFLSGGLFLRNGFLTEWGADRAANRKQQQLVENCKIFIQRPNGTNYPYCPKLKK